MLKDSIEYIKNAARTNFNKFGSLTPVFMSEINGEKVIMPLYWRGPEDKEAFSQALQVWISTGAVKEYFMVTESWVVKQDKDCSDIREWLQNNGSLADHPDRSEAVMIQYASVEEEIDLFAEIIRDGDKHDLGEWEEQHRKISNFNPTTDLVGRFTSLFAKSSAGLN